jgi:glycosyltransferase involved in cell wall biosynthesis
MTVEILLATYQGERFLRAQLDSLLRQTHADWRVLARDDCSGDGTVSILREYAARYPDLFFLVPSSKRLGAMGNFTVLLEISRAPHVMCCDQDDQWFPDKVARTLARMRALEAQHGEATPLLVHGDAQIPGGTFHHLRGLRPDDARVSRLLVQNMVLGCTTMANRALLARALPLPAQARMHDHWLALVAGATGHIGYIDAPLMTYRQHAQNAVGAQRTGLRAARAAAREGMEANLAQARALQAVAPGDAAAARFAQWPQMTRAARAATLLAGGYWRYPLWENLAAALFV